MRWFPFFSFRTFPVRIALPFLFIFLPGALSAQSTESLLTRAERTGFRETTRYDEVMTFLSRVVSGRDDMHLATMGYTFEGRPIPLVVVGRVTDASPEAVVGSGKTRVYLQGGIHAGEISGKEALLILLRQMAQGWHGEWLDSLVLLVTPLYNADGNERVNLLNRPRQNGPVGGMGQRANAQDLDLNRDHLKLDAPETRSLARMFTRYDPLVTVDLHTTDGTRHGYHLTYAPPLNPNTPAPIDALLRERLLPQVTRAVKEKHGWDMHDFGDVRRAPGGGGELGWYTFDHRARFSNNYSGLRNRFGILGEAFAYATFEERTQISLWFVEEILNFAHGHASEIQRVAVAADQEPLIGKELAVHSTFQRSEEPVTILMGEVEEELNPFSGRMMLRRTGVQTPQEMYEYVRFRATEIEIVPAAYLIPPELADWARRLQAHGVAMSAVTEAQTLEVEEFPIDSVQTSSREYQGRFGQEVWGSYRKVTVTPEPGTLRVPMDQPLARVVFTLLEPRSDDGFLAWGFLGDRLQPGGIYPVRRVPAPQAAPGGSTPREGPGS